MENLDQAQELAKAQDKIGKELVFREWQTKAQEKYHLSPIVANDNRILFLLAEAEENELIKTIIKERQEEEYSQVQELESAYWHEYVEAYYELCNDLI